MREGEVDPGREKGDHAGHAECGSVALGLENAEIGDERPDEASTGRIAGQGDVLGGESAVVDEVGPGGEGVLESGGERSRRLLGEAVRDAKDAGAGWGGPEEVEDEWADERLA